jgi:hypothetical protein
LGLLVALAVLYTVHVYEDVSRAPRNSSRTEDVDEDSGT